MIEYFNEALILEEDSLCEMANLTKSKSGLGVNIWTEHSGILRINTHQQPRVKLSKGNINISISIEPFPKVLAYPPKMKLDAIKREFNDGIEYVGRNYDIFLKHFNDTDDSFDDEDMFNALRERGEYK